MAKKYVDRNIISSNAVLIISTILCTSYVVPWFLAKTKVMLNN